MKKIIYILSLILLLILVLFYLNYRQIDLEELIQNGNEYMIKYCNESNLIPTFGLINISEYQGSYVLYYVVYTDTNKIHSVALYANKRGRVKEVSFMVEDLSGFLEALP